MAAFVGTVRAELRDASDVVRAQTTMPLGVYNAIAPRMTLPSAGLPAGSYRVVVSTSATRPDLPTSALTPATPARAETTLAAWSLSATKERGAGVRVEHRGWPVLRNEEGGDAGTPAPRPLPSALAANPYQR